MQFLNKICILKVLIYKGKIVKILNSFEHVTFRSIFNFYQLRLLDKQACGKKIQNTHVEVCFSQNEGVPFHLDNLFL